MTLHAPSLPFTFLPVEDALHRIQDISTSYKEVGNLKNLFYVTKVHSFSDSKQLVKCKRINKFIFQDCHKGY